MVDAEPEVEEKPLDPAEARKAREKEGILTTNTGFGLSADSF